MRIALALVLLGSPSPAAHLSTEANREFDRYVAVVETRLARTHYSPQLHPETTELQRKAGAVLVEPVKGGNRQLTGGLLHHWRGAVLVAGARREEMLAVLRNYDHLSAYYAPDVESSHALERHGENARVAIRFRKRKIVTVVLDAECEVESRLAGDGGGYSWSRSIHIWQIREPGSVREQRQKEGDDDGFLWRLNSYWSFPETPAGLLIECEAVSLTRDIPSGLVWLIAPIVRELPRASLEFTLTATRNALNKEKQL